MKCCSFALVVILVSGVILETSSRPASQAIEARRRRNRNNVGQRRIYLARQASPLVLAPQQQLQQQQQQQQEQQQQKQPQQQQVEVFEEELPTALTELDYDEPNQRIANTQSQRFIGTGFGSLFTNKQTLFSLLASTTTTTTTTTVAPTQTATGTLTGTITLTPTTAADSVVQADPIAPLNPVGQRVQQQVLLRPVGASASGPIVFRRRHGQGGFANIGNLAAQRRRTSQVIRTNNGGQIIRVPIPFRVQG